MVFTIILKGYWPVLDDVKNILHNVFQSTDGIDYLTIDSPLEAMPEMDSMAVFSILTALEQHYGFIVADDEIDASVFETVGTLVKFVEYKVNGLSQCL